MANNEWHLNICKKAEETITKESKKEMQNRKETSKQAAGFKRLETVCMKIEEGGVNYTGVPLGAPKSQR